MLKENTCPENWKPCVRADGNRHICGEAALKMLLSRTAAASWSKLFSHFRTQAILFSHRAAVGWIRRNNIDFARIMLDAIKDCCFLSMQQFRQLVFHPLAVTMRWVVGEWILRRGRGRRNAECFQNRGCSNQSGL